MYEKVNPMHPDKIADRIAGAIVDLAYTKRENPKVAVEVLIGHGICHIINETSENFAKEDIEKIVNRIAGELKVDYKEYRQDKHLADNQAEEIRCGDNGIFQGVPVSEEEKRLSEIARTIYWKYQYDGKYILELGEYSPFGCRQEWLIICQSNAKTEDLETLYPYAEINPLGDWTGGTDVDTGATNRKLGSDMGRSVTGGGLHGKDLSKADVSINIFCHLLAEQLDCPVSCACAIGDKTVTVYDKRRGRTRIDYADIVGSARDYINNIGGFEKFAEWGLI